MKKTVSFCLLTALTAMVMGPALTGASCGHDPTNGTSTDDVVSSGTSTASTSLNASSGGGSAPVVRAKWEMNGPYTMTTGLGVDDYPAITGAQFDPSGQKNVSKPISVCGIISDADGVGDINAVYGDVYYPEGVWTGPNHAADRQGCGKMMGSECTMTALDLNAGYDLFCNKVQTLNLGKLPSFASNESFATICGETGLIKKQQAVVYCCNKNLSYEDPDGTYKVDVWSQDKGNATSAKLGNSFVYEPVTAFVKDFTNLLYGNVKLNTWQTAPGDLDMATADRPTIENVGNTRLVVNVAQDDMGLGDREEGINLVWNVKYRGQIGSDAAWTEYNPFGKKPAGTPSSDKYAALDDPINLSSLDEADFGVYVSKFPNGITSYGGTIWLTAKQTGHQPCPTGEI